MSGVSPVRTELDDLLEEIIEKMELHAAEKDRMTKGTKKEGRSCGKRCETEGHGGPQPN